ncbi:hypothetical protein phytr_10860 [Candidatus Phycorickettsia trachydisci]|uniref:Uncharacterized protein n=1 Tax=Candidatus Phycorickettsia trachydisci TaxID=2115978 RepID=A0A2P1P9R1_9RICK|nr:hypothetical protein phytr_10860 [Candidatus Phycorickettsia trachydisci]
MHALPSNKDIQNLKIFIKKKEPNKYLAFIITVFCYFFKIINYLRFFGLDFVYAILIFSVGHNLLTNYLLEIF